MSFNSSRRSRIYYGLAMALVMAAGLLTRKYAANFPSWFGAYAPDALWALLVFLGLGFIFRRWPTWKVALSAVGFAYLIELSQLYHAPWISTLRHTRLGGLVLGFGFLWSDLVCYVVGVGVGVVAERMGRSRRKRLQPHSRALP